MAGKRYAKCLHAVLAGWPKQIGRLAVQVLERRYLVLLGVGLFMVLALAGCKERHSARRHIGVKNATLSRLPSCGRLHELCHGEREINEQTVMQAEAGLLLPSPGLLSFHF